MLRFAKTACCLLALSAAGMAQDADPGITMRATESFGEYDASIVIRLSVDGQSMPVSESAINAMLASTSIGEAALQEALGSTYPSQRINVDFGYTELGVTVGKTRQSQTMHQLGLIYLEGLEGDVVTATRAVERMVGRLRSAVEAISVTDHAALTERVAMARAELHEVQQRLRMIEEQEAEMLQATDRANLQREMIQTQLEDWQREMRELQLASEHRHVKAEIVADEIAKVAARLQQQVETDDILRELERVVDLREKNLDRVRALIDNGTESETAMIGAMEALAAARERLSERRDEVRGNGGAIQLQQLNTELHFLSQEGSSNELRLAQLQTMLEDASNRDVLRVAQQYENEIRIQRDLLVDRMRQVHRELMELEDRLRNYIPPRLTVVRGKPAESAPGR